MSKKNTNLALLYLDFQKCQQLFAYIDEDSFSLRIIFVKNDSYISVV